jgi:hypothetical protein
MGIIEDGIRNRLNRLKVSVQQLALLSGLRSQVVFAGLSGRIPLTGKDIEKLDRTLRALQEIAAIARPFDVDFSSTRRTQLLLESLDNGDLAKVRTAFAETLAADMDQAVL